MERKKGERYSQEFRHQAVQRMKACNNILGLSRELGIHRRLAFVALETLLDDKPLLATIEAFRMIEEPSGISGSAFCTVKSIPFTFVSKIES